MLEGPHERRYFVTPTSVITRTMRLTHYRVPSSAPQPHPKVAGKDFPLGGNPEDFCDCGHHDMNHASYLGMPRKCNQTGCECLNYSKAHPKVVELPPRSKELRCDAGAHVYCSHSATMRYCAVVERIYAAALTRIQEFER